MTNVSDAGESPMNPAICKASARVRSSPLWDEVGVLDEELVEPLMVNSERNSVRTS